MTVAVMESHGKRARLPGRRELPFNSTGQKAMHCAGEKGRVASERAAITNRRQAGSGEAELTSLHEIRR